ncbi:MAG: lipoprotein signal peptidase [Bacteroidaceae bacterium]|nr:lipoprotein signal peptidase [Bacteroidaceae bacterium]
MLALLVILLILFADQWIKIYVKTHFYLHESVHINGWEWANLYFIENQGMAFGMDMLGGTVLLCLFRILAVGVLSWLLVQVIRRGLPLGFIVCVCLVLAGAAGNIFDNVLYGACFSESTDWHLAQSVPIGQGYGTWFTGKVVDMFYFPLIDTHWPDFLPVIGGDHFIFFSPIFNFADAAITCGALSMVLFYRQLLQEALNLFQQRHDNEDDSLTGHPDMQADDDNT